MLDPTQLFWTRAAAVVVLLAFAGLAFASWRLHNRRLAGQQWATTTGDIIVSEVTVPQTHTSDDQPDARPVIRYRYGVGADTYEGDAVGFGGQTSVLRAHADALVAKYPSGAKVDVHYDPKNPNDAVLEPATKDGVVAQLAITIVFGVIGLILAMHAIAGKVIYTTNGVPLFAFALPGIAFIAAVTGFVSFANGRRRARTMEQWPTTQGVITTSNIVEESIVNKGDDNKSIERITKRYRVDLRYAYRVAQRDYVGTNALGDWMPIYGMREQAEKIIAAYPPGRSVAVHYNPAQPGAAVLEPGKRQGALAPLVFGALFAITGTLLLVFFMTVGFGG